MAALKVFREVAKIVDSEFLAMEVLPILWSFSLGPLLNLQQFQSFMALIKSVSTRIEQEQTRKLQEMSANSGAVSSSAGFSSFNGTNSAVSNGTNGGEPDFESLVKGKKLPAGASNGILDDPWASEAIPSSRVGAIPSRPAASEASKFSWSTPSSTPAPRAQALAPTPAPTSRAITPDHNLSSFTTLQPANNVGLSTPAFSQPLQPGRPGMTPMAPIPPITSPPLQRPGIDWTSATAAKSSFTSWNSGTTMQPQRATPSAPSYGQPQQQSSTSFSVPPLPTSPYSSFNIAPPPAQMGSSQSAFGGMKPMIPQSAGVNGTASPQAQQKQGMDKYQSLI
ncbi:hypothetical protein LTS18_000741 [Coniosporium uncinatum]|uniref:Uncharacterized protein n=1 Tax=Coniosporium uncinatum TaxID=93489 RepID=A0ACC3D8N1_9PEZI|nr:hypothetical protein LTS18_000741 [Coniosporium uncinatum]